MSDNPFAIPEVQDAVALPPRRWGSILLKVFLLGLVVLVLAALLLLRANRWGVRPAFQRAQCKNNLKQIGLALHNYHDDYGTFPPAYTVDAKGRPLHSWRTLVLPYLEQTELYRKIDLSKPWNDPVNAAAFETSLFFYQCPSADTPKNHTIYLGVSGPDCCFYASTPKLLTDITDGPSNTLIVVEVPHDRTVPWMSPQDSDEASIMGFASGSKFAHTGGFQATFADGSVRLISEDLERSTLQALLTTSGKDDVGEF